MASPSSGTLPTHASQYLDQQTATSDRPGLRPSWAVVVPVFNAERTLKRCVESVLASGCCQVVLVDDCSFDTTPSLLDEFEASGATVVRLDHNAGPAVARNHGARAAATDWLIFIDADDVLDRDAIRTFSAPVDPRAALVRARFARMDDASREPRPGFLAGSFAVRRDLFEAVGGYDEQLRFAENSELLVRLQQAMTRLGLSEHEVPEVSVVVESTGESRTALMPRSES